MDWPGTPVQTQQWPGTPVPPVQGRPDRSWNPDTKKWENKPADADVWPGTPATPASSLQPVAKPKDEFEGQSTSELLWGTWPGRLISGIGETYKQAVRPLQAYVEGERMTPAESQEMVRQSAPPAAMIALPGQAPGGWAAARQTFGPAAPAIAEPTKALVTKTADDLFRLRQSSVADRAEIMEKLQAAPPEFARNPAVQEQVYHAIEAGGKAAPLDPIIATAAKQHLEPLRKEATQLYTDIKAHGYPSEELHDLDPNYMHRMVKGKTPALDPVEHGEAFDPVVGTKALGRTTGALQERKYFALEAEDGRRAVVQNTETGPVVFNQGKRMPLPGVRELAPGTEVDLAGKRYKITQARTNEIEAETPTRYYKNAMVNTADAVVRLRAVKRNVEYLESLKQDPSFLQWATPNKQIAFQRGWKETKIPQLRDWYVHPKLRAAFDDFYRPGGEGGVLDALRKVNRFAVGSIFWNPVPHVENVWGHWFVGRGWDWLKPQAYGPMMVDGLRAMRDVTTMNSSYRRLLKEGSGLIYGGVANQDFFAAMGKKMGMEIERDPRWRQIANKLGLGVPDLVRAYYAQMRKVLWWANDVFMAQRVYELERRGLTTREAIKEAEKHIPNYRIPTQVMGSRTMSEFLQDPAFVIFGRYHYGVFNSYANMVRDITGAAKTPQERMEAIGNLMALGALTFGVYPLIDQGLYELTGDEKVKKLHRGPAAIPYAVGELYKGERNPAALVGGMMTMSPALRLGMETIVNKDFFTGRDIVEPADLRKGKVGRVVAQEAEHLAQGVVSPYATVSQATSPGARGIARAIVDSAAGLQNVSPRTQRGKALAKKYQARSAAKRKPRGLVERGERSLERYGGPNE